MKKISLLLFVSLLLIACQEEKSNLEKEHEKALQEVLDVHDEAMPKMGELSGLISELEQKIEEDSTQVQLVKAKTNLQAAHDNMMSWMKDFAERFPDVYNDKDYTDEELKAQLKLLEVEKDEVNAMRDFVFASIADAKRVLGKEE
ncbi:hypothetical protein [Mesonia sp. K7]|uniref:hypothetical protein n=1 Tax=Mesonia sp. K7 TaxID=2218606 RepID=UPI000DA8D653|nr:hypothetical protein [Mesonia sp. K7]PZD77600.1 hypothetical protein DNG35_08440 [Mesonia sp. K7]